MAPIFAERCARCHEPGGVAGLPLSTWRDVHAARDVVRYAVEERIMPPWPAVEADFSLRSDPSLTPDEIARISAWVEADAPLGDADPDLPLVAPPEPALPRVDAELWMPAAYRPSSELEDDLRCFVLEPDVPVEGFIRGYAVVVGNRSVVHHAKLSAVYPTDGGSQLAALEALDPEPGFACTDELDVAFGGRSERIGTWLPGKGPTVLPDGAGVPVDPGATFVLVVHYHTAGSDGLPDQSGVQLWLGQEVERVSDVAAHFDRRWRDAPEEGGLVVPAGDPDVEYRFSRRVGSLVVDAFDPDASGVDLLSAMLHMHALAKMGTVELTIGGETHTLVDVPRWDIDWQVEYWPTTPVRLAPDDEVTVTCTFDNASGDRDVPWGEGVEDEMCLVMLQVMEPAGSE